MAEIPDLNPIELEILRILWSEGVVMKPAEIESKMASPVKNANLRAILVGLVEKGVLQRELRGKAYFYKPTRAPRTVRRTLADKMASVFAEGSRLQLIAQLIRDEKLSPGQIQELQDIIDDNE